MPASMPQVRVEGGTLREGVDVRRHGASHARITARVAPTQPARRVEVVVEIRCERAWSLSHRRTIVELPPHADVRPPFPVGRFVVTARAGVVERWDFSWCGAFRLRRTERGVVVRAMLSDPSACGLASHGVDRLAVPPGERTIAIGWNRLASPDECVWLEPYPDGVPAAVCLTDHADWDTVPKLRLLTDLFGRTGVRLTKSVFPASQPKGDKREPGLDDADFARLCRELAAQGSEIAFHGIGPRVQAPPMDEWRRRAALIAPFAPRTWIDHGCGSYLFSREGRLPDGSPLLEFLAEQGVTNVWSYADKWDNPFVDLGAWRGRTRRETLDDLVQGWGALRRPRRRVDAAYLAIHAARNLVGADEASLLRAAPLDARNWVAAARGTRRFVARQASPLIYGTDGTTTFAVAPGATRVFDTVLLNHLALQLRPERLARVVRDSELLLGHCYLAAEHDRIRGNAFVRAAGGAPALDAGFVEVIEALGGLQRDGEVVTLPLADLVDHLDAIARATLVRTADGWEVASEGGVPLTVGGPRAFLEAHACRDVERRARGETGLLSVRPGASRRVTTAHPPT